jgi:hypothetical protein
LVLSCGADTSSSFRDSCEMNLVYVLNVGIVTNVSGA